MAGMRLRGELLSEDDLWYCLNRLRDYEIFVDESGLSVAKVCKQQIDILNNLSDEQWGHLSASDIDYLIQGQHDLESFQEYLAGNLPSVTVPTPPEDFARFYVFAYDVHGEEGNWPLLVVVDNGKGAWEVRDAQSSVARIQFKFVADDGTESILETTNFSTNHFLNVERDLYFIPPASGRLYWRYHDFGLATSNSTVRGDGEWAGGMAITYGFNEADYNAVFGNGPPPYVPVEELGDMDWSLDAYFARKEREHREAGVYLDNLTATEALREKMSSRLYPEDFFYDWRTDETGYRISELDPAFAPQWALDGQALLKKTFKLSEYYTVMNNLSSRVESYRGYKWRDITHGQIISMSAPPPEAPQSAHDRYNEWLTSDTKRRERFKARRAEIAAKRAGTVTETSWEWEKRLNDELAAAKLADDQAEVTRLKAELAAGYGGQQATPPAQGQQNPVQGNQVVQEAPGEEEAIYPQVRGFMRKLKKALERENLFQQTAFDQLKQSIVDNDMPLAYQKLDAYEAQGGRRVDRAVKRLRKVLKLISAKNALSS